ncbi:MAG: TetR/AcrR family transcriptional regulator [Dehalococcoidia bacterium]|nr:TetR/AcrR family transcriptional regulator [Dehalococcoidia bacterium]
MLATKRQTSEVRRRELIDEARKIVASRGMEGLTIKNIARAVGISEGAIYRHFRGKNEILVGLVDEVGEVIEELVRKAEEDAQSPLEKLEALLKEHLSSAERRHGVSFLVIAEVLRNGNPHLRHRMQGVINSYLAKVEEILEDGVRHGQINPECNINAAAIVFFGLIQGAVILWRFASPELPLAERYQVLWQIYRDGVVRAG